MRQTTCKESLPQTCGDRLRQWTSDDEELFEKTLWAPTATVSSSKSFWIFFVFFSIMDDMTFLARDFLCFLLSFFYLFFIVAFPVFSSFFLLWNMFCEFVVFFSSRKQHFCRTPNDQAKRPNKGYLNGTKSYITEIDRAWAEVAR